MYYALIVCETYNIGYCKLVNKLKNLKVKFFDLFVSKVISVDPLTWAMRTSSNI